MSKNIIYSKTFILAVVQGIAGIVAVVYTAHPDLGYVVIAKSIIDIALRAITNKGVTVI